MKNFKKIIAVGSGKGGVGKSTIASALAVNLAKMGNRVGLLDADLYGPSQDKIMNLKNGKVYDIADEKTLPTVENYGVKVVSMGSLIEEGQALAWRGPMLNSALKQMLGANWGNLDILVIDLPPGTGDVVLSLAKMVKIDGAVVVSTPQDIALIDAKKAIDLFQKTNTPLLGFVENMSYHVCKKCGNKEKVFNSGSITELAEQHNSLLLAQLPLDIKIRQACDAGESLAELSEFQYLASRTLQQLDSLKIKVKIC